MGWVLDENRGEKFVRNFSRKS